MNYATVFRKLNGREATAADNLRFERLVSTLETTPDDALLAVLVALDHYRVLYETIPKQIQDTASSSLLAFSKAADKVAEQSMSKATSTAITSMSDAVSKVAVDVASKTAGKNHIKWLAGSILGSVIVIGGLSYLAHKNGIEAGKGIGYQEARDEKAAAVWGGSLQGQRAYKMAQSGALDFVMNCDRPGWEKTNDLCVAGPIPKGEVLEGQTYGWRVP